MRFKTHVLGILFSLVTAAGPAFSQTISGTVRDGDDNPVGGSVRIYDSVGDIVGDFNIDPSAYFQTMDLAAGNYFAVTVHTYEKLDEAWNDIPCENLLCDVAASTPIVVGGTDVTGIDFVLDPILVGGHISGLISDGSDNTLADVGLELMNENGEHLFFAGATGPDGHYQTGLLADGSYYLFTINEPFGLGRKLYDEVPCLPADDCYSAAFVTTHGTPIVIDGTNELGVDFSLEIPEGGQIIGQVSDADLGIPLPDVHLDLLGEAGNYLANTNTDPLGNYYFSGLAVGNYKVLAIGVPEGYTQELYGGDQCPGLSCDLASLGTVISISGGTTLYSDIDIAIDFTGTRIVGTVTRSDSSDPVSGQYRHMGADLFNDLGDFMGTWPTNRAGQFQINLPGTGNYYLNAINDWDYHGLINEVWDGIKCYDNCNPLDNGGTLIQVTEGVTSVADFELDPGFRLAGSIRIEGALTDQGVVNIWNQAGQQIVSAGNNPDGNWASPPLAAGTYFATVRGEDFGMVSQLYNGLDCPHEYCDVTAGTPIVLSDTDVSGIDFDLAPFTADWTISGTIRDENDMPIPGWVRIFDPGGGNAGDFGADPEGNYQSWPLPDGTYFVATINTWERLDEAWDDVPCENLMCDVTASTPIVVSGGNVSGIDFVLEPITVGGRLAGTVQDDLSAPLADVSIEVRNANGEYQLEIGTAPDGSYETPLLANDTYFLVTRNEPFGLGREVYDDHKCLPANQCDNAGYVAANGTPVVVEGADVTGIDFVLEEVDGGLITGRVSDADIGIPLPDIHVVLLNQDNFIAAVTDTDPRGDYYFSGLADGSYKVYAEFAPPGYMPELYEDVPCPQWSCDFGALGTPITIDPGQMLVTDIDILLDYTGTRLLGTVTRSDTGEPVSAQYAHMGVDLLNEAGQHIGGAPTNRAGQYQIELPGSGNYYLRAINDQAYHGLINEVWDGIRCYHSCEPLEAGGNLIPVAAGTTVVADFVLDPEVILSDGFE